MFKTSIAIARLPGRVSRLALLGLAALLLAALVIKPELAASLSDQPKRAPLRMAVAKLPAAHLPGAKVRTPSLIEAMADRQERADLELVALDFNAAIEQLRTAQLDAWVGTLPANFRLPDQIKAQQLPWSAAPMAIMRTDTDIKAWSELRQRSVCLSSQGRNVGQMQSLYQAREQIYPSATDALLALRIGECDAAVMDQSFLQQLLKFPEWQKFSASLKPAANYPLWLLQSGATDKASSHLLAEYLGAATLNKLASQQAQDIAFEVYLDQTVPDCH